MTKKIPFLDLRISDRLERESLLAVIDTVFRHGRIVMGPEVERFEKKMAEFCSRRYAVGVNSGSDALFLALKSLDVGPGDEVITTSLSWIATANAIALTGARPVFADIADDLNIAPESVVQLITPRTKAILPVHYTGKICAMDQLLQISSSRDIAIIEDASQAFGARLDGCVAGSFGRLACFSMNPMKIYAACGEAGVVVTDQSDIYDRLIALRYNGTVNKETCIEPSLNGRIDTIQAAILLQRFEQVEKIIQKRREIAARYNKLLADVVGRPGEQANQRDVYYTYTIQADSRDELKAFLESRSIETKIQHPCLMPLQPAYRDSLVGDDDFPNARRLVGRILSLPAHEKMDLTDVDYVASCIHDFYR